MDPEVKIKKGKRFLLKSLVIIKRMIQTLTLLFILLVLCFLLINSSNFLSWSKARIISFLKDQIENKIEYSKLDFNFFKGAQIEDFIIYDHHDDTLIYAKKLEVNFAKSLISLIRKELYINDMDLSGVTAFISTYPGEVENSFEQFTNQFKSSNSNSNNSLIFNIRSANIDSLILHKINYNTGDVDLFSVAKTSLSVRKMDLMAKIIDIDHIELTSPSASLFRTGIHSNIPKTSNLICNDSICIDPMVIICEEIQIKEGKLIFNKGIDTLSPLGNASFNANHFFVENINLNLHRLLVDGIALSSTGMQASCNLNGALDINNIQFSNSSYGSQELKLDNFKILTDNSRIGDSLYVKFGDLSSQQNIFDHTFVEFLCRDSRINVKDLLYFIPKLYSNDFLQKHLDLQAEIAGHIMGRLNSLKAFNLVLDIPNKLEFRGDAFTRNIASKGNELLNLNIKYLLSNSTFLQALIPSLQKVKIFEKIGQFRYTGKFDGYFEDFVSYGVFNSDLGILRPDIRLNLRPGSKDATWAGKIELQNFNLGKMLDLQDLEKVSLVAEISNGKGLQLEHMNVELNSTISSLMYKSYNYENLKINAVINRNLFDGTANIKDKNLDIAFKGKISDLNSIPKLKFNADIAKMDLKALNLSNKSFIISGNVESNILNLDLDKISGNLLIKNGLIYDYNKNHILNIGYININQSINNNKVTSNINSEILNLESNGEYKVKSIYNQLMTFLNDRYSDIFSDLDIQYTVDRNPLTVDLTFDLMGLNKISNFFDWDVKSSPIQGRFILNNLSGVLQSNFNGELLKIKNLQIDNLSGHLNGHDNNLDGKIFSAGLKLNNKYILRNVNFEQNYANSVMHFKLSSRDSSDLNELNSLQIGSIRSGPYKKFYFEGENILINGKNWQFAEDASLLLGKKFISLNEFVIFDSTSKIELNDINNLGITLDASTFNVAIINPILKSNSLTFSGLYNLHLNINNVFSLDAFDGKLNILNLRINKMNYGRFDIAFNLKDPNEPINLSVSNNYKETSIAVNGSINIPLSSNYTLPKYDFNLIGNVTGFQLYFLESFISSISQTKGTLSGPIKIYRQNKKIYLDGDCVTSDASTKINYLNTNYSFNNQKIKFEKNLIIFDDNTIYDALNNPISANGTIEQDNLTYFNLDIVLKSKKALILNTTKSDNIYYYGYGIMSFQCSFKGLTSKLEMDFKGKSEKGTNFVIPVRYEQESKDTKFVKFKSKDTINTTVSTQSVIIKGMNIRMDVEVTEDCEMSIIFDEKNGDILRGNGAGNLQIASLRDNTFTIKGNYEINSGQYLFTLLNFVNKPFKIKKGGTINWTGDPLNADIDLEASYEGINISPSSLIEEYLASNPTLADRAKERTKVDMSMLLKGSLLQPDINFKLGFPDLNGPLRNIVDTKVRFLEKNPEQMNQQVASLILFRTFINSNSNLGLQSGFQSTTFNTFTEFLSNQVSIFVSSLLSEAFENVGFISGVDFNVNYDANKTILGTQTNASEVVFNLRHRLWNDQWAVSIGGNYGNSSAFNKNNSYFNPESVIEWNTPVTGLKMRIYYKGIDGIDGVRHRVGTGVSYRKEFNSLSDFKKGIKEQKEGNAKKDQ